MVRTRTRIRSSSPHSDTPEVSPTGGHEDAYQTGPYDNSGRTQTAQAEARTASVDVAVNVVVDVGPESALVIRSVLRHIGDMDQLHRTGPPIKCPRTTASATSSPTTTGRLR